MSRLLLRSRILRLGLQSMGCAGRLFMGLGRTPWYGYYGYYFNPYPAYATAALWMTDYVISQNLQNAYSAQAEANANANAAAGQDDSGNQDASAQGGGKRRRSH